MTLRDLHVVVPTIDAPGCESLLLELTQCEYRMARLTVVVQGTPSTASMVEDAAHRRGVEFHAIVLPAPVGAAAARMQGAANTVEPYVGFVDDDIGFQQGTLSALVDACEHEHLGGAAARIVANGGAGRIRLAARSLLFRGIFSDPRARRYRAADASIVTPLLPSGAVVYRTEEYERCAAVWAHYGPGYTWGEDAELSYCISRRRVLAIVPAVAALNRRQRQGWNAVPREVCTARLERYRRFADRHVASRRDAAHYSLVLLALLGAAVGDRGGIQSVIAIVKAMARAALMAIIGAQSATPPWGTGTGSHKRDVDVVVRSLGRPSTRRVIADVVARERRVRRVVLVWQGPAGPDLADVEEAARGAGMEIVVVSSSTPLGLAGARRAGLARVSSPWVAFLDDDIEFEQGSIDDLVAHAERMGAGGAGGYVGEYDENTWSYRVLKALLFRGIFKDPRTRGRVRSRPYRSPVLSGGIAVFRHDLLLRSAHALKRFQGYGWGEDFEISFSVSRDAPLYVLPSVRVRNGRRGLKENVAPVEIAVSRLARYRDFALAHAASRRQWAAYGLFVVGVSVHSTLQARSPKVLSAGWPELRRAASGIVHPRLGSDLRLEGGP